MCPKIHKKKLFVCVCVCVCVCEKSIFILSLPLARYMLPGILVLFWYRPKSTHFHLKNFTDNRLSSVCHIHSNVSTLWNLFCMSFIFSIISLSVSNITDSFEADLIFSYLTLVMLNKLRCYAHFQFSANQIT